MYSEKKLSDDSAVIVKRFTASSDTGEWKCPECHKVAVCECVRHVDKKPVIKCLLCGAEVVVGRC